MSSTHANGAISAAAVRAHLDTISDEHLATALTGALDATKAETSQLQATVEVLTTSVKRTIRISPHPDGGCRIGIVDMNGKKLADGLLKPHHRDALIAALAETQRWGVA